jgi:hypothetical protein
MKFIGNIITSIVCGPAFAICGFLFGLYFPWDDIVIADVDPKTGYKEPKFYWYSIPGRVLGMIVCSIIFGVCGFVYGLIVAWQK